MQLFSLREKSGFTVIELLVVVVIIAVLAAIVVASANYAVYKARVARVKSDLKEFEKVVLAAESTTGKDLKDIVGPGPVWAGGCWNRDLRNIPDSDSCMVAWTTALNEIQAAAGNVTGITGMKRDPWGSPYLLDNTTVNSCNWPDTVWSPGTDGYTGYTNFPVYDSDDILLRLPLPPTCQ